MRIYILINDAKKNGKNGLENKINERFFSLKVIRKKSIKF